MDWGEFMDYLARKDADRKVNYAEIRDFLDPYNIIKTGQAYPNDSVEYFLILWNGSIRRYENIYDEMFYDAEDWINLIVGENHVSYFFRKMCEPGGFFMSSLANEISLMYIDEDTRRWVGTASGMVAIAIRLCSWRVRPGLDTTRINHRATML